MEPRVRIAGLSHKHVAKKRNMSIAKMRQPTIEGMKWIVGPRGGGAHVRQDMDVQTRRH